MYVLSIYRFSFVAPNLQRQFIFLRRRFIKNDYNKRNVRYFRIRSRPKVSHNDNGLGGGGSTSRILQIGRCRSLVHMDSQNTRRVLRKYTTTDCYNKRSSPPSSTSSIVFVRSWFCLLFDVRVRPTTRNKTGIRETTRHHIA